MGLIRGAIESIGLVVYGFLVAAILPTPSELALTPSLPYLGALVVPVHARILLTTIGKTAGSFVAFFFAKSLLKSNLFEEKIMGFLGLKKLNQKIQEKTIELIREYGYVGLFLCLAIPGAPDTISIYGFSFIETNRNLFLIVVFFASLLRFYLVLLGFTGLFAVLG